MSATPSKVACEDRRCGWHGASADVLRAPDPFNDGCELTACPKCRAQTIQSVCDEPGCWEPDTCGTPTPAGYRRTCGKHGTMSESFPNERQMQDAFCRWLNERGIVYFWQRMDRDTTGTLGWPDYTIISNGFCVLIETKFGKGQLSAAQKALHGKLLASGTTVHVCRSLADCVSTVTGWLSGLGRGAAVPYAPESGQRLVRHGEGVFSVGADKSLTWLRKAAGHDFLLPSA